MKITSVEGIVLSARIERTFWSAMTLNTERHTVLVRIRTDEGIEGLGEAFSQRQTAHVVKLALERELLPLIVGKNPFSIAQLWEEMFEGTFLHGRRGILMSAISGVDIALYDIVGKAAGMPIYQLLGGFHEKILAYATGGHYMEGRGIKELQCEVAGYVEAGFKAVKIKIGKLSPDEDIARVRAVREAIGPSIKLMVDANRAYDAKTAIYVARKIEDCSIYFFEEPVSPEQIEASVKVAQAASMPVCGYETESTVYAFRELISRGAIDIAQQDVAWSGGLTECKRVADLAYAWGLKYVPHSFSSTVALTANLHLAAAVPNAEVLEFDRNENALRDELLVEPIQIDKEGFVKPPQKPGLGIETDKEAFKRFGR